MSLARAAFRLRPTTCGTTPCKGLASTTVTLLNDDSEPRFAVDGLQIDLAARVVRRESQEIHLTPLEFKLLRVLLRHRGRPLTHPVLLEQIWGPAYIQDRQTLRRHVANLRRKIELGGAPGVIRTEHGIGYRFAAAPRVVGETSARAPTTPPRRAATIGSWTTTTT